METSFQGGVKITQALTIECSSADNTCIFDCEDDHRVVVVEVTSGSTNLIGIKITRGSTSGSGAGMWIRNSEATITSCLISDNNAPTLSDSVSTSGDLHLNFLYSFE